MKSTITILLLSLFLTGVAQNQFNCDYLILKHDLQSEIKKHPEVKSGLSTNFLSKYAIQSIEGEYFVSFLAKKNSNYNAQELKNKGIIIGSEIGSFLTLRVPIKLLEEDFSLPGLAAIELAQKIHPNLNKAVKDTRVDSVQQGLSLPKMFTGKNVLIGITDWGFDYTNPMFFDSSLTQTRILRAWDQYRLSGPPPVGYTYGTEIIGHAALQQAQCDTFNIYEWATHGSHVAGISGGGGAGTIYKGVAPDANFILATFLVDQAAVVDAFNWMKNFAQNNSKRLVINMSWGLYWMGNLDGSAIFNQIIDQMSADGVTFVSSAGNNGDENLHIKKQFSSNSDTLKTIVGFNPYTYAHMWGQSISAWGEVGKHFSVGLKVLNSSNQEILTSIYYSTLTSGYFEDTLIIGSDSVFYNIAIESVNAFNNRPHLRLRVKNTNTSLKIALYSYSSYVTKVHFWNVIELSNDVGNWGGPFLAGINGFTAGDAQYSIGDPASTESLITVAAHTSDLFLPNGTTSYGNIASFSSFGPTLDERMKPDVSAPGVNIVSSISSFTNANIDQISVVSTIPFNNRNYQFVKFSGTSMSSPMVTGIVALILEAAPNLTPAQVKMILQKTAREDIRTGVISDSGNTRWGFGKVNALAAVKLALITAGIGSYDLNQKFICFPNPTKEQLIILGDNETLEFEFEIYSLEGKMLKWGRSAVNDFISVNDLAEGEYILLIRTKTEQSKLKFIKI